MIPLKLAEGVAQPGSLSGPWSWPHSDELTSLGPHAFNTVELEILTGCDLTCFGCDRMSDITNAPNMTLDQVRRFVDESLELGQSWERIRLLGGEPTLHPQMKQMADELIRYRRSYPSVFLQILSNGQGKHAQYKSYCADNNISLHCEYKVKDVQPAWFNNTRIVPVDRDPNVGELPPCSIFGPHGCGVGLTRNGFYLDGAGATAARVAGHDIGVMALKDVTWAAMLDQARVLCRICGHWNSIEGKPITELVSKTGFITGKFWSQKISEFHNNRPKLRIYGDNNGE